MLKPGDYNIRLSACVLGAATCLASCQAGGQRPQSGYISIPQVASRGLASASAKGVGPPQMLVTFAKGENGRLLGFAGNAKGDAEPIERLPIAYAKAPDSKGAFWSWRGPSKAEFVLLSRTGAVLRSIPTTPGSMPPFTLDQRGHLYVLNSTTSGYACMATASVVEYGAGTAPLRTIPIESLCSVPAIAADAAGTLYVANEDMLLPGQVQKATVEVFPRGKLHPTRSFVVPCNEIAGANDLIASMDIDAAGNLFVDCQAGILFYRGGTPPFRWMPYGAGIGAAFDNDDTAYIMEPGPPYSIAVYPFGESKPSRTIAGPNTGFPISMRGDNFFTSISVVP
jgi:hypothetical protein